MSTDSVSAESAVKVQANDTLDVAAGAIAAPLGDSIDDTTVAEGSAPSVTNDENYDAFPVLGGASASAASNVAAPISWGPSMKAVQSAPATNGSSNSNSNSKSAKSIGSNVQEAFVINKDGARPVTKDELIEIIAELRKKYSVSINSTLSSVTKNRSIVVTGKAADVTRAKREILRRLSKPTKLSFKIPAKTRSAIIGAGGKNLKPIIDSTGARVDIERNQTPSSDSDDFEEVLEVTLEGDSEGCALAKKMILDIVNEETKNLSSKLIASDNIRAFIKPIEINTESLTVTGPNKSGVILLSGLRDEVIAKKAELSSFFDFLAANIKTQTQKVPRTYHQFIIAKDILDKFSVVVKFPPGDVGEEVTFTGEESNVKKAIAYAREQSKSFTAETLDISKAHGANVSHARALAAYFQYSKIFSEIGETSGASIGCPSYTKLADSTSNSVPIQISAPSSAAGSIKAARKAIVEKVNALPPSRVLFVSDISAFFAKKVVSATESAAKSNHVAVVPLSQLSNGSVDDIILVALEQEEEEFAPSQDEIDARLNAVSSSLDVLRAAQADLKTVVLDVPEDKQQFIEGPKGTTLKSLLASSDELTIKLHSNGSASAADKVYIQGSKSTVTKVQKDIEELLKDAADQKDLYSFQTETKVPVSVLSRLIGKNGAQLTSLREQFDVDVNVEKNPTGEKATVTITGYKYNVKEAEQQIGQLSKKFADEITKTLIVPKKYRASLIGYSGKHVKKLETKYNVRINSSQDSDEVTIRGPSRGANKATEELKDLLDFEIENGYTKEITVPQSAISRVIGRSGETINRIIVDAGIDIDVKDEDKNSDSRVIVLTGSRKGLTEAEKQIMAIVKDVQNTVTVELEVNPKFFKDILGSKGSTKQQIIESAGDFENKDYRKLLQIPDAGSDSNKIISTGPKKLVDNIIAQVKQIVADKENSVTEAIVIPKEKHRLVIGTAGSVRRSLEEDFGVTVKIPRVDDKSETITIVGLPEKLEQVKAKIIELTADDWKAVIDVPAYLHGAVAERGGFTRRVRIEHDVEIEHGNATNRAHKLSSKLPAPSPEARGTDDEQFKFTVVEDSETPDSSDTIPWRLKGGDQDVALVEQQIKDAIKRTSKDNCTAFFWVKDSASTFRKIVGPQGSRLTSIKNKAGAQIYVPRNTDKNNDVIVLRGTKDTLAKAEKLLLAEIQKK